MSDVEMTADQPGRRLELRVKRHTEGLARWKKALSHLANFDVGDFDPSAAAEITSFVEFTSTGNSLVLRCCVDGGVDDNISKPSVPSRLMLSVGSEGITLDLEFPLVVEGVEHPSYKAYRCAAMQPYEEQSSMRVVSKISTVVDDRDIPFLVFENDKGFVKIGLEGVVFQM